MSTRETFGGQFGVVLASARAGESWALERIYTALSPAVAGLLHLQGAAEPDDLTSEVFIGVLRNLIGFESTTRHDQAAAPAPAARARSCPPPSTRRRPYRHPTTHRPRPPVRRAPSSLHPIPPALPTPTTGRAAPATPSRVPASGRTRRATRTRTTTPRSMAAVCRAYRAAPTWAICRANRAPPPALPPPSAATTSSSGGLI